MPGYDQEKVGLEKPDPPLDHAGILKRLGAYIIDAILIFTVPILIYLYLFFTGSIGGFGSSGGLSPFSLSADMFTLGFVLFNGSLALLGLLYFTALEGGAKNATFGKRLLNIRVVDEKGDGIDMKTSFVRNLLRLLWDIPTLGTFIMVFDAILVAEGDQRIGDKVADTYVVKENKTPRDSTEFPDGGPPFSK